MLLYILENVLFQEKRSPQLYPLSLWSHSQWEKGGSEVGMGKAVEVGESVEDEGITEEVVPSQNSKLNLDLRLLDIL